MGAQDNRAVAVAAFWVIQRFPKGRTRSKRIHSAYHTHTRDVPLPCPAQRQAPGGSWADPTAIPLPEPGPLVFRNSIILVVNEIVGAEVHASYGKHLRRLLVAGATSATRQAETIDTRTGAWVRSLLARRPARLVTVAIANKTARTE